MIGFETIFKITVQEAEVIIYYPKWPENEVELSESVAIGEAWSFALPPGEHENESTSFSYDVNLANAATFMTFDETSLNIESNVTDTTSVGSYSIEFWLVDEFGLESDKLAFSLDLFMEEADNSTDNSTDDGNSTDSGNSTAESGSSNSTTDDGNSTSSSNDTSSSEPVEEQAELAPLPPDAKPLNEVNLALAQ